MSPPGTPQGWDDDAVSDHFRLTGVQLGVATAATQIEGGDPDSNWTDWAARPGTIADGSSPVRATDHWHRWRDDTELLASLGIPLYRMSVEWARVEPRPGEFDEAVLAQYRRELTLLLIKGIRPLVTLHHFSHPMWFERLGAFESPDAPAIFERFTRRVVEALGDLVDEWVTINEPNVYVAGGYVMGNFPPGVKSLRRALRVYGVLTAAHIAAYRAIHELRPGPATKVGVAHHLRLFRPANPRNPYHRVLARGMTRLFQTSIVKAMTTGEVDWPLRRAEGIEPGCYADFFGLNYYSRSTVSRFADGTATGVTVNDLGWEVYAAGLGRAARWAHHATGLPIWITENGTCDNTDAFRSRYLFDHLQEVAEAVASGVPIERYYHWCFVDNWEWDLGEGPRFGLVALDYETQHRTVKESGRFYAEIVRECGVTPELHAKYVAGQQYPTN
jgi:beta-glucosidase